MKCYEIRERISWMLDGELSAEETALVTEHVASCPECMRVFEAFHMVSVSMEGLDEVPEGFTADVMDRIHAAAAAPKKKNPRILRFVASVACFAILLLAGTGLVLPHLGAGLSSDDSAEQRNVQQSIKDSDADTDDANDVIYDVSGLTDAQPTPMPSPEDDSSQAGEYEEYSDLTGSEEDGICLNTASCTPTPLVPDPTWGNALPTDVSGDTGDLTELLNVVEAVDPELYVDEPDYIVMIMVEETETEFHLWLEEDQVICKNPETNEAWIAEWTPEQVVDCLGPIPNASDAVLSDSDTTPQ